MELPHDKKRAPAGVNFETDLTNHIYSSSKNPFAEKGLGLVGSIGIEPTTSSVSRKRSPPELTAQVLKGIIWWAQQDSNL
jgi:hypothetical protein